MIFSPALEDLIGYIGQHKNDGCQRALKTSQQWAH